MCLTSFTTSTLQNLHRLEKEHKLKWLTVQEILKSETVAKNSCNLVTRDFC